MALVRIIVGWVGMLLAATLAAQAPSPSPSQPERDRVALVIGNATYRVDPLDNPVNDARLVARALAAAQFKVTLHENLNRQAMIEAMRRFGAQLNERSVALVYYAGHGLQLRDRNFLIPTDAEIHSEAEIPLAGVDVSFILDQMSSARSRVNIVILDACRNNPFAGRAGRSAQGLAQMDAPVGTLLAYATGPGKLAADGLGSNGIYATHLARQIASSVEQVEIMFRRVREGVVRETREQQTPWESSSLQGDFAFHGTQAAGSDPIQVGPLAIARPAEPAVGVPRGAVLPRAGDTFRYRVQDQFRLGDLYVTARVDEVRADAIIESWSASSGARSATPVVTALAPRFNPGPGWDLTPPEFSPYLQGLGSLRPGQKFDAIQRRSNDTVVTLAGTVEGEEEVVVPAGKFRAVRVALRGSGGRSAGSGGAVKTEYIAWYAPEVKRLIKYRVATHIGTTMRESTVFELVEFKLN